MTKEGRPTVYTGPDLTDIGKGKVAYFDRLSHAPKTHVVVVSKDGLEDYLLIDATRPFTMKDGRAFIVTSNAKLEERKVPPPL